MNNNKNCILFLFLILCQYSFAQNTKDQLIKSTYAYEKPNDAGISFAEKSYLICVDDPLLFPKDSTMKILKRVSYNYFIVRSSFEKLNKAYIKYYTECNNLWKVSDNAINIVLAHPNRSTSLILYYSNSQHPSNYNLSHKTINLNKRRLDELILQDSVIFIDCVKKAKTEMSISDLDLGTNAIIAAHSFYPNVTGAGINISIKEDIFDTNDIDLLGKAITNNSGVSTTLSSHATIMATMIAGLGNSYYQGLGSAPAAKLSSSNFDNLMPDDKSYFIQNHIFLQNHSYGTTIENFYSPEAMAYDSQVYLMDTVCHVFSSGNIGTTPSLAGLYTGLVGNANLSGGFKQAKNVLVVGGTDKYSYPTQLSSRGPAYDGRIKPDIVATGEDGTSGSAALVSGVIALLQNAYVQKFGRLPSSSMIKSTLITSADKIGGSPVDYTSGFGALNGIEALRIIDQNKILFGSVTNKQNLYFPIDVPDSTDNIKMSLAWTDPPTNINAPVALVNDIDMVLETPDGKKILPWGLSTFPNADSLGKSAVRKRDSLNTVEFISLDNTVKGKYNIQISGTRVANGTQPFFITYSLEKKNFFEWVFPLENNSVIGGNETVLHWKSSYANTLAALFVSYDNGVSWTKITDAAVQTEQFSWFPSTKFTKAILKMIINGKEYRSQTFIISTPLKVKVGYLCTDETLLYWNKQQSSSGYVIYSIKDSRLQQVAATIDTFIVIPTNSILSNYFAVSAKGNDGFEGEKSQTIDITTQGVNCYYRAFLASLDQNKQAKLTLTLSTSVNLGTVVWEKMASNGTYIQIGSSSIQNGILSYSFTDPFVRNGIQYYRATIKNITGNTFPTTLSYVINLDKNAVTLFPNPCSETLNILSGDDGDNYDIKIFDINGKLQLQKTLQGALQSIPTNGLIAGSYIAVISSISSKNVQRIKFIKL